MAALTLIDKAVLAVGARSADIAVPRGATRATLAIDTTSLATAVADIEWSQALSLDNGKSFRPWGRAALHLSRTRPRAGKDAASLTVDLPEPQNARRVLRCRLALDKATAETALTIEFA